MASIADVWVTVLPNTARIAPGIVEALRKADPSVAEAGRRWAQTLERELSDVKATVEVDADTAKAEAQIDAVGRDRKATIEVDVDRDRIGSAVTTGVVDAVSQLGPRLSGSAASAGSQIGTSMGGPMSAALMAAGVTAVAGIASGLAGLTALVPAGLLGGVGVIGTLATGLDGVKDAWDAAGKAASSSGKDQESQAKAVASAQQQLRNAVRDEASAQKDVASARRDARQQLEDLNLQLRGGVLDEKQAILDAQAARRDLRTGRFRDSIEYEQAQLRVQQADQRVAEARERNEQTQARAADANAKGVDNADQVVAANDRLAQSQERVAQAQSNLTEAQSKSSTTADNFAQAMAALSPNAQNLITTLQALKPIWDGLKMTVQDSLFAGVGEQIQALATTYMPLLQSTMAGMAGTMNQAFQGFAAFLQEPETLASLQGIFANIGSSFQVWSQSLEPVGRAFLTITQVGSGFLPQLADMIVQASTAFNNFVQQAASDGSLQQWIQTGIDTLGQLGQVLIDLGPIFGDLAPIAGPTLEYLHTMLVALQPAIAPLATAFGSLVAAFTPLMQIAAQALSTVVQGLAPAFTTWMNALAPVTQQIAGVLLPVMQQLLPIIQQNAGILAGAMVQGINTLLPVLIPFVQQAGQLYLSVGPLVPPLIELAVSALPAMQQAIAALLPFITQWMGYLTNIANVVVPVLVDVVGGLADTFSTRFQVISDVVKRVYDFIEPLIKAIGEKISQLTDGPLGKLLEMGGRLAAGPLGSVLFDAATSGNGTATTIPTPVTLPPAATMPGMVAPRQVGSDDHLTPATSAIKGQIAGQFPQITNIGGYREDPAYPNEHPAGKAIDVMIPKDQLGTSQGTWLGDQIASFALRDPNVDYVIWNKQIIHKNGAKPYTGPNPHTDHVHVHTEGGSVPGLSSFTPPAPSTSTVQLPTPAITSPAAVTGGPTPASTAGAVSAVPTLTAGSSRTDVAQAIIAQAQRRGFSREQTIAVLSTALQESNLTMQNGGGGAWHGIFQQDTSYPGRDDPNTNIGAFFDRLGAPTGDIWSQIFKLQQGTPYTASNARTGYLSEIQSKTGPATELFDQLAGKSGVPDMGAYSSPIGTQTQPMYVDYADGSNFSKKDSGGQQLGQDIVSGIMEIFGIDGSVFPNLMNTSTFKGAKSLTSFFTGLMGGGGAGADTTSGAVPGGGDLLGGALNVLSGIKPQPFGDLQVGGQDRIPTDHAPSGRPGPGEAGQAAMNADYRIIQNFNAPVGSAREGFDAAKSANIPRMRQGMRPLPS